MVGPEAFLSQEEFKRGIPAPLDPLDRSTLEAPLKYKVPLEPFVPLEERPEPQTYNEHLQRMREERAIQGTFLPESFLEKRKQIRRETVLREVQSYAMRYGLDPEKEGQKITNAFYLAEKTGLDFNFVLHNLEAVQNKYFRETTSTQSAWSAIKEEGYAAMRSIEASLSAFRLFLDPENEAEYNYLQSIYNSMPETDMSNQPLWAKGVGAATGFLPSMGITVAAGLLATVGGPVWLGPLAMMSMLTTGATFGDVMSTRLDNGKTIYESVENKKDVFKIARVVLLALGVGSAAIELAQISKLFGGITARNAFNKIVGRETTKWMKEKLAMHTAQSFVKGFFIQGGTNIVVQNVEEVLQMLTDNTATELAKRIINESTKLGIPKETISDWEDEFWKTVEQTTLGSAVLGIGGSIAAGMNTFQDTKARTDILNQASDNALPSMSMEDLEEISKLVSKIVGLGINIDQDKAVVIGRIIQGFADGIGITVKQVLSTLRPEDGIILGERVGNQRGRVEFTKEGARIVLTQAADIDTFLHEFAHVARHLLPTETRSKFEKIYNNKGKWDKTSDEAFANDFIRYLREGVAPKVEQTQLFDTLKNVLKNLIDLLPGKIDPEVADVFENLFKGEGGKTSEFAFDFEGVDGQTLAQEGYDEYLQYVRDKGYTLSDLLLSQGGEWAKKELGLRKILVEDHPLLARKAQKARDFNSFIRQAKSDLSEEDLKRIYDSQNPSSRSNKNREFYNKYSTQTEIKLLFKQLQAGLANIKTSRLAPQIEALLKNKIVIDKQNINDTNRAQALTASDIAYIQQEIRQNPFTYREALARATNNKKALAELKIERKLEVLTAEMAGASYRHNLIIDTDDKKLIEEILAGLDTQMTLEEKAEELEILVNKLLREQQRLLRSKSKDTKKLAEKLKALEKKIKMKQDQQEIYRKRHERVKGMILKMTSPPPDSVDVETKKRLRKFAFEHFYGLENPANYNSKKAQEFWENNYGIDKSMARDVRTLRENLLEDLYLEYDAIVTEGRVKKAAADDIRKKERNEYAERVLQEQIDKFAEEGAEISEAKKKNEEFSEYAERIRKENPLAEEGTKERRKMDTPSKWAFNLFLNARPARMIRHLSKKGGALWDLLINGVETATDNELRYTTQRRANVAAKMKELGIKASDFSRMVKFQENEFTVQEAMSIYIYEKNGHSYMALTEGNGMSKETIYGVIDALDQKYKEMSDTLMIDLASRADAYKTVYEKYTNNIFEMVENYFPIMRDIFNGSGVAATLIDSTESYRKYRRLYVDKTAGTPRVEQGDDQARIRLGAIDLWNTHMVMAEHFIHSAEHVRLMQAVTSNQSVQHLIQKNYGSIFNRWLATYIDDFAEPQSMRSLAQLDNSSKKYRHRVALASLAFNAMSALKAGSSVIFYATKVNPLRLVVSMGDYLTSIKKWNKMINEKDPQMRDRAFNLEVEEARVAGLELTARAQKLATIGMKMIGAMDALATRTGWIAVYKQAKSNGMSDAQAAREAQRVTLDTQPANRGKDLPQIYRSGEIMKWFLQFTGQLNQIWNITTMDLPDAVRERNMGEIARTIGALMTSWALMAVLNGWEPGEGEEPGKDTAKALLAQVFSMIPLLGPIVGQSLNGFTYRGVNLVAGAPEMGKLIKSGIDGDYERFMNSSERAAFALLKLTGFPAVAGNRVYKMVTDDDLETMDRFWTLMGRYIEK